MTPRTLSTSLLALAALGGCAGSETGNGAVEHRHVAVVMRLDGGAPGLVAPDSAGVDFAIDHAQALVDELDLWLPDGEPCSTRLDDATVAPAQTPYVAACSGDDTKLRVPGPWLVDLATGALDPSLDALDLPDGPYARIDARLRPARPGESSVHAGDPLDGKSIDVGGSVVIDGATRRWDLHLDFTDNARFVPAAPVEVGPGVASLMLLLDVSTWFDDLDLAACIASGEVPTDADGIFMLADTAPRCGNVEAAIRREIREAGRLETH